MPHRNMTQKLAYGMVSTFMMASSVLAQAEKQEQKSHSNSEYDSTLRQIHYTLMAVNVSLVLFSPLFLTGLVDSPIEMYRKWQAKKTRTAQLATVKLAHKQIDTASADELKILSDALKPIGEDAENDVKNSEGQDWASRDLQREVRGLQEKIVNRIKKLEKHKREETIKQERLEQQKLSEQASQQRIADERKKIGQKGPENSETQKMTAAQVAERLRMVRAHDEQKEKHAHEIANDVVEKTLKLLNAGTEAYRTFKENKGHISDYLRSHKESLNNHTDWEIAQTILNLGGLKQKKHPDIYAATLQAYGTVDEKEAALEEGPSNVAGKQIDKLDDSVYVIEDSESDFSESDSESVSDDNDDMDNVVLEESLVEKTQNTQPVANSASPTKKLALIVAPVRNNNNNNNNNAAAPQNSLDERKATIDILENKHRLLKRCNQIHTLYEANHALVKKFVNKRHLSIIRHGLMHIDFTSEVSTDIKAAYYKYVLARLRTINFDGDAPSKPMCFRSENMIYREFEDAHHLWEAGLAVNQLFDFDDAMGQINKRFDLLKDTTLSQPAREMLMVEIGEIYQQLSNAKMHKAQLALDPRCEPAKQLRSQFAHTKGISKSAMDAFVKVMHYEVGSSSSARLTVNN